MTTQTPPRAAPTKSGAASIADRRIAEALPALADLLAAAETVAAAVGTLDQAMRGDRIARINEFVEGSVLAVRGPSRLAVVAAVQSGEIELGQWLQDETAAAQGKRPVVAEAATAAMGLIHLPPGALMADARRHLKDGDPEAAMAYVTAGRMTGAGNIVRALAEEVEAALDKARPERAAIFQRIEAARREYLDQRFRLAGMGRIADTLSRNPELGAVDRDPGVMVMSWDQAMADARALLPTP